MSRQSRWIYRDMLDVYYDSESPLPLDLDVLCAEIGVESDDERKIVERLLRFKFIATDEGYRHERCDAEIATYHAKADIAKKNGKLGGRPRKANQNPEKPSGFLSGFNQVHLASPDLTGSQANQEPRTNNQEKTNTAPDGFEDFWKAYPKKKARPAAIKAFKAAKLNGSLGDVLTHVATMSASDDWTKDQGQFVPYPATYLNQRRWEDEMSTAEPERSWV